MIRTWTGLIIGWLIPVLLCAQNPRIDSLQEALSRTPETPVKADQLHALANESWDYDFEQGLAYAKEALVVSKKNQYIKGEVQALTDIGQYYYFTGKYTDAYTYYQQALQRCGTCNFGDYPAYTLTRVGNFFRVQAEFDSARKYYDKTLKVLDGHTAVAARSSVLYNLGQLSIDLAAFEEALPLLRKSLSMRMQAGDSLTVAECYHAMGKAYRGLSMNDSAMYFHNKAFAIARRYNDPEQMMFYYLNAGEIHFAEGSFGKAIDHFSKALEILQSHPFKRYYALVLVRIAQVYDAQGDFRHALEHLLKALPIQESLNNKQEVARAQGAIGWVYVNQGNRQMGAQYANRSLALMHTIGDRAGVAFANNLLGYIHYSNGDYAQALIHYEEALRLRREIKSENLYAATLFNMSRVYERKGEYVKARDQLLKVLSIDQKNMDNDGLVMTYNTLGSIEIKTRQFANALPYLHKAQALAKALGTPVELRNNYQLYAELYRAQGDYVTALKYYDRYTLLNDSLFTQQNATKIAEMNALYELEKKEHEIQVLNQTNAISQNQIALQTTQLALQRSYLTFSIGGIFLLCVMAYVLFQNARIKARANAELRRLNSEISEQKEEIQAQSEELTEANTTLISLNNELIEKTEEVQAQSEELRETNEMITEINRDLDDIVTKRTSQLQEAYKELDTFFYRSSHDFRRPLTTFMGLAEVAKITLKDAAALELFSKVKETAVSLDKMLIKLQSISDMGAQQLVYKEVWIKEIFGEVCNTFRDDLERYRINVITQVNLKTPFISYPAMVKLIVENLVENAINFCVPEGPYIYLRARQEGDQLIVEVEDNGQGILPQYTERVFEMYFRANERSKGNGLGLYIVRKSVEKLHGTVSLETELHKGSRFTITFPMEERDSGGW